MNTEATIIQSLIDAGFGPNTILLLVAGYVAFKYFKGNGFAKQSDLAKSEERIMKRLSEIDRRIESSNEDHHRIDVDLATLKTKMGLEDRKSDS